MEAVLLCSALAFLPGLEALALHCVWFEAYGAPMPLPACRLRKYSFQHPDLTLVHLESPRTVQGWAMPLAASTATLVHLDVAVRTPDDFEEIHEYGAFTSLRKLELRSPFGDGLRHDAYWPFLATQCPTLRDLSIRITSPSRLVGEIELIAALPSPLGVLELGIWSDDHGNDESTVDSLLQRAVRFNPALRKLRRLGIQEEFLQNVQVSFLRTRSECRVRRIIYSTLTTLSNPWF
ncbi:hypothetical protein AURDEDRAFT_129104 [Auricularia subglabra TFB-10046 SS5]|nr:hypothetical protein AURDEDRAFT_129104 [Auricularia subglabra TFB-10046 SS5]